MFFTFARMQCWGLPDAIKGTGRVRDNQGDRSMILLGRITRPVPLIVPRYAKNHGPVPLIVPR